MELYFPQQEDEAYLIELHRAPEAPVGNPLPPEAIAKLDAVMKLIS